MSDSHDRVTGIGVGFRMDFAKALFDQAPDEIRWLEVHPENYMRRGGRYPDTLRKAQERYPVVTHGLTMCYGSLEPFDREYLHDLRDFLGDVGTPWHSDHLCFGGVDGVFAHDLLPLPFDEEAAHICATRLMEARDVLDRPLAVENVSYYAPSGDPASEVDFVVEILERTDAKMLLDVNNVYVNSKNHGFDPRAYIDKIPPHRVVQMHIAGHFCRSDEIRVDTHGESVCEDVYQLLDYTLRRMGPKPVLLERDNNIPPFADLMTEVRRLDAIYRTATATEGASPRADANATEGASPRADANATEGASPRADANASPDRQPTQGPAR
jgi:hypothetical protein